MFLGIDAIVWVMELEFGIFAIFAIFSIPKDYKPQYSITKKKLTYLVVLILTGTIAASSAIFLMRFYNDWFGPAVLGIFGAFALSLIYRQRRPKLVHER